MGHHNRHFGGDPHALHGAWSPPNSRANFCEEDYVITRYLAEFINSLTNIAYIYYALRYMCSGPRPRVDSMSLALLVLGICSFLFHATMRATLEFADELGMLGLAWSFLQATLTARQPPRKSALVNAALAVFVASFSGFYVYSGKIIYHVIAFGTMMVLVFLRGLYLFHRVDPPLPREKCRDWNVRMFRAAGIVLFGYFLWHVDLELCAELRALREQVGLPWAWFFELHGWWHVLTAIGAGWFADVAREIRRELEMEKKAE